MQNVSQKRMQDFKRVKSLTVGNHSRSEGVGSELYLRKLGKEYFVYHLGRNGEAHANQELSIEVQHKDFKKSVKELLRTDSGGKVALGALEGVKRLEVSVNGESSCRCPVWDLRF